MIIFILGFCLNDFYPTTLITETSPSQIYRHSLTITIYALQSRFKSISYTSYSPAFSLTRPAHTMTYRHTHAHTHVPRQVFLFNEGSVADEVIIRGLELSAM